MYLDAVEAGIFCHASSTFILLDDTGYLVRLKRKRHDEWFNAFKSKSLTFRMDR